MNSIKIQLGCLFAIIAGIANTAATTNAPGAQVTAYYFHGTVRCETCLKIERQAREFIERRFKPELAAKRLVFEPVNYLQSANTHFQQDYKLPCPSLVLVRQESGQDIKWKLLGQTWTLVETSTAFEEYIEKEVNVYLSELGKGVSSAGATNSPSKEPVSESTPGKKGDSLFEMNVLFGDMNAVFVFVHATNEPPLINWVPMNVPGGR